MMRSLVIFILSLSSWFSIFAQNTWNVYVGGTLSHDVSSSSIWTPEGDSKVRWGGGFMVGGGYEIYFNSSWSFSPSIELSFTNNGEYLNKTGRPLINESKLAEGSWAEYWSMSMPLTVGYRVTMTDRVKLKIELGAFISQAFYVRQAEYKNQYDKNMEIKKSKSPFHFGNNFQTGAMGGISIESGDHLSYFIRTQYPFLVGRYSTHIMTISLGIKYAF